MLCTECAAGPASVAGNGNALIRAAAAAAAAAAAVYRF
jgi:hypothetical protein